VPNRACFPGDILDKNPDIRAFRAGHTKNQPLSRRFQQIDRIDSDRPRWTVNRFTLTSQGIESLTILLQGRVHRRNLHGLTFESLQNFIPFIERQLGYLGAGDDLTAIRVARGRRCSQSCCDPVRLVCIQQKRANLGRFAEAKRQHSRRRRIQTARMPGFLRI
jgi:hypothetical protein